jgi:hypothetical protein
LEDLRERLDDPIPLAWTEDDLPSISAIEVYPAATLRSRGLPSEGYKKKEDYEARERLLKAFTREVTIEPDHSEILANDNIFDAMVCALAGTDFIMGRARISKEGRLDLVQETGSSKRRGKRGQYLTIRLGKTLGFRQAGWAARAM